VKSPSGGGQKKSRPQCAAGRKYNSIFFGEENGRHRPVRFRDDPDPGIIGKPIGRKNPEPVFHRKFILHLILIIQLSPVPVRVLREKGERRSPVRANASSAPGVATVWPSGKRSVAMTFTRANVLQEKGQASQSRGIAEPDRVPSVPT
jgi:hypothetical protein